MIEHEIILSNDVALDDDGWALIAPLGEWPKTRTAMVGGRPTQQRFIQVLDNDSADALVSKENSLFGRLKRAVIGIPVYRGHPDLRDHAPETVGNSGRKEQIGVIDQVRKSARGVEGRFVLSPEGATAVENGAKFPSALWLVQPCGERDGATLARPFKLLSAGLTDKPNIAGVESLANSQENMQLKELIIGALVGRGFELANETSDQQLVEIIANGDYPGHPFHGNQYGEGTGRSTASSRASHDASKASGAAMKSGSREDHFNAQLAHNYAAAAAKKAGNTTLAMHHDMMANMHADAAKHAK
jgi:hypothetical protein